MRISDWSSDVCSSDLFAVEQLQIQEIIVTGHYGCGGITAAVDGERHGLIDHWLQPIRDTAQHCVAELDRLTDPHQRLDRLCELNVIAQVRRVAETPIVLDAWSRQQPLLVHGLVYGLKDGRLRTLDRSEEHTSELQSLMRHSYAVFCL